MKRRTALTGVAAALIPLRARGASDASPYKLGLTIPLSGPYTSTMQEYLAAYDLGVAELNQRGGIDGRSVKLLVEDSQATAQGGIAAMRKLVEVDAVTLMMTTFSNVILAQIPLSDQLQMPTVAQLELADAIGSARYTYAHGTPVAHIHPLWRDYWKEHGYKRIYAFFGNSVQFKLTSDSLRDYATAAGAAYDAALLNTSDIDFRGEIARLKDFNPDGIFLNTAGSTADPTLLRQLRESGVNKQLFVESNFYTIHAWRTAVESYLDGVIFGGPRIDRRAARDFVQAYQQRLGFEPGYPAAQFYDVVKIAAYGIAHGGGTASGIINALATMKGVPSSFGGTLTMGADHYTKVASVALWQVRKGEEVRVFPT